MIARTFTVKGTVGGVPATVTWTEGEGFDDPLAVVSPLIATKTEVCATVTGPCFDAADEPGHVALLTAVSAFDLGLTLEGGEDFVAELQTLSAVPAGATP